MLKISLKVTTKKVEIKIANQIKCQACLKKTGVELDLLSDIDMLLMVEREIRGGMCHAIHRYGKANND